MNEAMTPPISTNALACYQALKAHDARFDGRFFVGVSSTRIYCRPVCRVKVPKFEQSLPKIGEIGKSAHSLAETMSKSIDTWPRSTVKLSYRPHCNVTGMLEFFNNRQLNTIENLATKFIAAKSMNTPSICQFKHSKISFNTS